MATIEDYVALSGGVSPTLNRIIRSAEILAHSFQSAGTIAGRMANAIADAAARSYPEFGMMNTAATAAADGIVMVGEAARSMNVDIYARQAGETFTTVGETIGQTYEEIRSFTASAAQATEEIIHAGEACNELKIPSGFITDLNIAGNAAAEATKKIAGIGEDAAKAAHDTTALIEAAGNLPGHIRSPAVDRNTGGGSSDRGGPLNRVNGVLSNVFSQLALENLAASGIEKVVSVLSEAPGKLMAMSDQYSGIQARLNLVAGSQQEAALLNDQIYFSALRARGGYVEMVDAVSKIGMTAKEAFPDPRTVVPFMENIQKLFVIGGADIQQQKDALLRLTEGFGRGSFQGDEFRSIAVAAPPIEKNVADYMRVSQGELEELFNKGEITAELMKNAILSATQEINAQFETIPKKWSDIWQELETKGTKAFAPVFEQISALANSPLVQQFVTGISVGMIVAGKLLAGLINNVRWLGNVIGELYSQYQPVFDGLAEVLLYVAAVWAIYKAGVIAASLATAGWALATSSAAAVTEFISILGFMSEMFYTLGAAETFAAMSATELWAAILLPIALVIALIYIAVAAINHFTGANISATGLIVGAFFWLGQMIYNVIIVKTWNILLSLAEFIGNFCKNPLAATYNLFADIWNGIVELVGRNANEIIGIVNKLPGMELEYANWGRGIVDRMPIEGGYNFTKDKLSYESGNSFSGYNKAGEWKEKINELTELPKELPKELFKELFKELPTIMTIDDIANSGRQTADNTKGMCEAMDLTEEDVKYMHEAAEQEAINQYTTAEVKIELGGVSNNLYYDTDIDGVIDRIVDGITEGMAAGAEAVHV